MTLIDGKKLSIDLKERLTDQLREYKEQTGIVPKLVAIIVGDDPASKTYVGSKEKACEKVAINSEVITLPEATTEQELLELIDKLNNDSSVHAILVQLPLPTHINKQKLSMLSSQKKTWMVFIQQMLVDYSLETKSV